MTIVDLASAIADRAHAGQVDKAGKPYIGHVRRVAGYVDRQDLNAVAAALLHDVLEDTPVTAQDLAAAGIPSEVVAAVVLVTRRPEQSSEKYYAAIRGCPLAREVKLADLADNTDPRRQDLLESAHRNRLIGKYNAAYAALEADPDDGARRRGGSLSAPLPGI